MSEHAPFLTACTTRRSDRAALVLSFVCLTVAGLATTSCAKVQPHLQIINKAVMAAPNVARYTKFEASFTLPDQTGNPFDPADNDINVILMGPNHLRATVPAFWDGERWVIRYAPPAIGDYALSITRNGTLSHPADLSADHFHCIASQGVGFVRRDPKIVQRFVFDNGQSYYPLGMDVAWTNGKDPDYPTYFADMDQAHMNWVRVWANSWDGKNLEWASDKSKNPKIGTLSMNAAQRWDMVFDQAEKNGIYVQMTLQHHGQYTERTDPNWRDNPFNAANGGFLKKPDDFFTDPEARRLTKAKYRYIVARWGYSTHLLAYELFNEVQNIGEVSSHFQDVVNWHKEMASYIRSLDTNHHLVTTSNSDPGSPLSQIGLDYDQIHTYPPDVVSTFASVRTADLKTPMFFGEWGLSASTSATERGRMHDGLWASMMAPTAGAGQYWYGDQIMAKHWWPEFASATGFVRTFAVADLGALDTISSTVDAPGARGDLTFAPVGGWESTTKSDIGLSPDGGAPDLTGVSSFIQGENNRKMMPKPITFHLNCVTSCRFEIHVGNVAKSGAHLTLSLDGTLAQQQDFPAGTNDQAVQQVVSVDVPAGQHTVALFNSGVDWFVAKQITVTDYVPAVAVLAKGNSHAISFWAYNRDRANSAPRQATLHFANLAPGKYRVRLWDVTKGSAGQSYTARVSSGNGLNVSLKSLMSDVAGVVVPAK